MNKKGKVYLIGAGPGDEELLTLKAQRLLKEATVILYDNLSNSKLLGHCNSSSEKIYVGKKASQHTLTQDEINQLLVKKAKEGNIVARLKGGDPFVFGRGSEEAMELIKNNIEFEIVPGITSGIAVPAYAGIPVTHRGFTSTVAFVTGHEDPLKEDSDIAWDKISTGIGTLIFYMGVKNISFISSKLIENGRNKETPVALIRWGTHNFQETLTGTLENIAQKVLENNFKAPAIIIVGEVVKLRNQMRWFDNKPLFGKTIIVTRSRTQASDLVIKLQQQGANVIELPTIEIEPITDFTTIDKEIHSIEKYTMLVFTSVNGVEIFFKRLFELNFDSRILHSVKIVAIGSATSDKIREYGIKTDLVPRNFTSEGVVEALDEFKKDYSKDRVFIPSSNIARDIIPEELKKKGATVTCIPVYNTILPNYEEDYIQTIFADKIDLVTFTSSSTVTNFVDILKKYKLEKNSSTLKAASIGPITSQTLKEMEIDIVVDAKEHTISGLVESILTFFNNK